MGCGSLSTTALPASYGTYGEVKGLNFPLNKGNTDTTTQNEKRFKQSNNNSQRHSPLTSKLKSESESGAVSAPTNGNLQSNAGLVNRFTMSMREIDEEKHKHDHGGIWLGTETNDDEQTHDNITSDIAQASLNEDFNSAKELYAKSATNMVDPQSCKPATTTELTTTSIDKTTKPLPATASFLRRSQKHRHLQDHRIQYDSVEEEFSNSFGHFDDDKQMSDSELDDYALGLVISEPILHFSDNKYGIDNSEDDVLHKDDDNDDGRNVMLSRLPGDRIEDICNLESDYSLTGALNKEQSPQSPMKTRDAMLAAFSGGMSLETLPVFSGDPLLPHFMVKCVRYIEAHGLKTEGLYRISGNRSLGEQFLKKYSADPDVDIAEAQVPVHVIATLLKSFVNNLSEALIPSSVYDELVIVIDGGDRKNQLIMQRDVIKKLPTQQFATLKYIIDHLHKVTQYQEFNSMNSTNLARCWWPTLIRLQFGNYENLILGSQIPEEIVRTLIDQCEFIFSEGNEV